MKKSAPKTPKAKQTALQAMVWYKEEDWDTLIELFTDSDLLPPTYAEWLARAEEKKEAVQQAGHTVIKIFIDPVTFPAWCTEKGMEMNAEARAQLAIEVAQAQTMRV